MTTKQLTFAAAIIFICLLILNYVWVTFATVPAHGSFFLISNILFFVLLLFTFLLAHYAIKIKNSGLFLIAFMGSIGLKFMAGIFVIGFYTFVFKPADWWYLLPFFITFIAYKGLELFGMMVLNQNENLKAKSNNPQTTEQA